MTTKQMSESLVNLKKSATREYDIDYAIHLDDSERIAFSKGFDACFNVMSAREQKLVEALMFYGSNRTYKIWPDTTRGRGGIGGQAFQPPDIDYDLGAKAREALKDIIGEGGRERWDKEINVDVAIGFIISMCAIKGVDSPAWMIENKQYTCQQYYFNCLNKKRLDPRTTITDNLFKCVLDRPKP